MQFKFPLSVRFSTQIIGLVVLVAAAIALSFFTVQTLIETKRQNELQSLSTQMSDLFRQNLAELNTRLVAQTNLLGVDRNAFTNNAQNLMREFPAILAVELRSTRGDLLKAVVKHNPDGAQGQPLRKTLPPWLLSDFEIVATGSSPKLSAIYSASLNPYFANHLGELQFLVEEFFPLTGNRGVMVVIFNPSQWFFSDSLVAHFQKNIQYRFKLENPGQEVIASSDNSDRLVAERDRYVTPISYFTDRPLYLAIENLSSARANTTHVLEILVFALAILIVLASVFIFKGWREYSNAQATLRMHEQMLLEQSKFVSMGEISTILSHELNQPLATIETYSTASQAILAQAQPDQAKLLKAISAIRDETARISKIIKNIRSFIVNNQTQVMEIDAALLLDSLKTVLQMQAAHYQAQLVIEKKDSFTVEADRLMLEQVILNLSRNAFEAMRASPVGKRTLSIQIVREQNLGKLIFSDSGPGISAEVGAKLFTPFFSTKTDSMGIGLSLCRSLVERYQGQLHWQNNSLGGAQFTISFAVLERRQARDAVLDSSFSRRHAV